MVIRGRRDLDSEEDSGDSEEEEGDKEMLVDADPCDLQTPGNKYVKIY